MRRSQWVCLGALVFCLMTSAAGVMAQVVPGPTPPGPTTTTSPALPTTTTSSPTTSTTTHATTTTTAHAGATTSTTKPKSTAPIPPPASGASQPLVPDLLGSPVDLTTTTVTTTPTTTTTTSEVTSAATAPIAARKDAPSAATMILATIAWLAALGGLLVYAEDRRSTQWKHLAR